MHKEPKIENNIYNNFNLILKTSVSLTKMGKFLFCFSSLIKRYKNNYNIDEDYLRLKSIIKKQNINFIDVNEEIQKLVKDPVSLYSMKKNSHYSPKGYKIISDLVYKKIFNKNE